MSKTFIFFISCAFLGCNNNKNEDSITYIRLRPSVLFDTIEKKTYLNIKQYAEYRFSNKDSLFIGVSGYYSSYYDNNYIIDNKKLFHFGLEKFYTNKVDRDFSELMTKILSGEYKESYKKEFGEGIDDRPTDVFVINRNGKQKFILYFEKCLLPEELKKADSLVESQINLSTQETDMPNYSLQIILNLQDSLFRRVPPPPPPLNATVEFTPPIIDGRRK